MIMAGEVLAPANYVPVRGRDESSGGDDDTGSSASPTSPSQPAGAGHDTKIFGNLEGRDPDLLFAGEKIMIGGKQVTVADGDTLSSLAAKHDIAVEKLISENKMGASLAGKNGPGGAYFTPGGPQPAPGGSQTQPPNSPTVANSTTTPSTALSTAPSTSSAATPSASDSAEDKVIKLKLDDNQQWKAAGLLGGLMNSKRAEGMLVKIESGEKSGNTHGFTPEELSDVKSGLHSFQEKQTPLSETQKDLVNKYMVRAGWK
jgi:hypothetical protein